MDHANFALSFSDPENKEELHKAANIEATGVSSSRFSQMCKSFFVY